MEVVFDTRTLAAGKRRQAWRDAICEIYLQVDCQTDPDVEYVGLVRGGQAGRGHHHGRGHFARKPSAGETTTSAASERIATTWGSSTSARSTSASPEASFVLRPGQRIAILRQRTL